MTEALILLSLFVMIAIGLPIAVAILASALVGVYILNGHLGFLNAALSVFDGATSFPLIAIPLFILAGALMNTGGISRRLINFVSALIGFMRGGLAMVNVGVSLFFAEISGSAVADVAAIGSVLIPAMKKKGYSPRMAAAVTSSSASLAIIIPPSIPMILYGALSDTSIVQLFVAGIVPGLLGGFGMMALCYYFAVRYDLPREEAFSLTRLWKAAKDAGWALILPVIILGGIFGGFVTATEGAGLAVIAALVIGGFVYREIDIRLFYHALTDGVIQTAVVMLLVASSAVLGLYLTETEMPQRLAASITTLTTDKFLVLMIINVFLLFVGMVLHGAAAIILTVPIFMPLVHQIGIDPVQFGILLTLNIALGQQTPPVASVLVTACSIARTDIWRTTRTNLPFIGILLVVLLLVTYVPAVSLSLVDFFYK
ncbi:MAG: TRAP transporter large permease [Aurantimonas coralicida]|mgnify:FL=1|uniref:TRAP transporter large permease protein n=2 Tax=Hyphomicrobiales TaxID=356 RepID=A0A0N7KXF6_9HYPH|nr:TRAP transporter large permease [Aurantimonas coralicida]ADI21674.1 TRAP-type C4-dicarboxylate transport system, large permease component [uncultured Rhizobium sp. HF0130_09F11]MCW7543629.1 TRAP transporter large permease [Aurantimonas litoralis]MCC4299570.1 TRAP transporter large permease [Aurantimonas coralicida]MDE0923540.1 TRAP transporter large permease [Aurantimonas coralicida]BAT26785.1 TRAP-type C4-dicarboxylate transporter, DctM subunit [Aurantimonas coralicida]